MSAHGEPNALARARAYAGDHLPAAAGLTMVVMLDEAIADRSSDQEMIDFLARERDFYRGKHESAEAAMKTLREL